LAFHGFTSKEVRDKILNEELEFKDNLWHSVSEECIDFIKQGMTKEIFDRPTSMTMLDHNWLKCKDNKAIFRDKEIIKINSTDQK